MINFLIGPLVGGVIGYITNHIAIKMLFKPLKPVYIFNKQLPFTPGMIPREQERIAKTIGTVIEKELIDTEMLKQSLLAEETTTKIEAMIYDSLKTMQQSTESIEHFLGERLGEETVQKVADELQAKLTADLTAKLNEANIVEPMIDQLIETVKSSVGPMMMFVGQGIIDAIKEKATEMGTRYIQEEGGVFVASFVADQKEALMHKPVFEVADKLLEEREKINEIVLKQYRYLIETTLQKTVEEMKIGQLIESKIKQYEPKEMEKLILGVVNKELKAIVWLGALLGAMMGLVMYFF